MWRREREEKKGTEILKMRRERGRMINNLFMLCAGSHSFDQKKKKKWIMGYFPTVKLMMIAIIFEEQYVSLHTVISERKI